MRKIESKTLTKKVCADAFAETRWLVQIGNAGKRLIPSESDARIGVPMISAVVFPVIAASVHTGCLALRDNRLVII